jgi:hypothetical protein
MSYPHATMLLSPPSGGDKATPPSLKRLEGVITDHPRRGGPAVGRPAVCPSGRWLATHHLERVMVNRNTRQTGTKAASAAGKVLANPKSTKSDKAAAASALSQTPKKRGR